MKRPIGVTVSAVVAIIGSLISLLLAVVMVLSALVVQAQQPEGRTPITIGSVLFFLALGALGIWTAIGLFRLRAWARTSILVFAGFLAVSCLIMLVMASMMPLPAVPNAEPGAARMTRPVLIAIFGIPFAIGVWWLFQFNRKGTIAAFSSGAPTAAPARPLSISIIGWVNVIGGISCLFPILARIPAFMFGVEFTGWSAGVVYAFFGALSIYIGRALLDLRERGRRFAIGWFVFSLVHIGVVTFVPTLRRRMLDMQRRVEESQAQPAPFDAAVFANVTFVLVALMALAAIWFLVRNRGAFRTTDDEATIRE